jgi:hypothetical protein
MLRIREGIAAPWPKVEAALPARRGLMTALGAYRLARHGHINQE